MATSSMRPLKNSEQQVFPMLKFAAVALFVPGVSDLLRTPFRYSLRVVPSHVLATWYQVPADNGHVAPLQSRSAPHQ